MLVPFLLVGPAIYGIQWHQQYRRTETHRDMFHKTTLAIHYPNPDPRATDNDFIKPVLSWLRDMLFGGGFPEFPPSLQEEPIDGHLNKFREGDSNLWPEASGWRAYAFPDGFPNTVVLGWKYDEFKTHWILGTGDEGTMTLKGNAGVVRSPWTYMGWPFIPTQDCIWEPDRVRGWYNDNTVDGKLGSNDKLKLLD